MLSCFMWDVYNLTEAAIMLFHQSSMQLIIRIGNQGARELTFSSKKTSKRETTYGEKSGEDGKEKVKEEECGI